MLIFFAVYKSIDVILLIKQKEKNFCSMQYFFNFQTNKEENTLNIINITNQRYR